MHTLSEKLRVNVTIAAAALALLAGSAFGAAGLGNDGVAPAGADGPLAVNGGWRYMSWSGNTVFGAPFTYVEGLPTTLRVTDAFCYGDQFRVSNNGVALGETSTPGSTSCGGPFAPDAAYADPNMSSGCFIIPPGASSITLDVVLNPFGGGGGYIRADTVDKYIGAECVHLPL